MSETKFTKGPWKAKYYLDEDEWRIWTNDSCVIAFTDQWANEFDFEVAANAHLIAAAPELYEALEELMRAEAVLDDDNAVLIAARQKAAAALARARGASHD